MSWKAESPRRTKIVGLISCLCCVGEVVGCFIETAESAEWSRQSGRIWAGRNTRHSLQTFLSRPSQAQPQHSSPPHRPGLKVQF